MKIFLATALTSVALITPAEAADWTQPYGGCKEAWQAPHSAGAQDCRDHGWVVRARVVVGPRGYVRYLRAPACRTEDGPGPCFWDARSRGNGQGSSFFLTPTGRPITLKWTTS